eukprot:SAG22_NODE_4646_length_1206_cov_1.671183_1_plen_160_part_00
MQCPALGQNLRTSLPTSPSSAVIFGSNTQTTTLAIRHAPCPAPGGPGRVRVRRPRRSSRSLGPRRHGGARRRCPKAIAEAKAAIAAAQSHPIATAVELLPVWDKQTCSRAAERGHLEVLKWARANGCPWDWYAISCAGGNGHAAVAEWSLANGCPSYAF